MSSTNRHYYEYNIESRYLVIECLSMTLQIASRVTPWEKNRESHVRQKIVIVIGSGAKEERFSSHHAADGEL